MLHVKPSAQAHTTASHCSPHCHPAPRVLTIHVLLLQHTADSTWTNAQAELGRMWGALAEAERATWKRAYEDEHARWLIDSQRPPEPEPEPEPLIITAPAASAFQVGLAGGGGGGTGGGGICAGAGGDGGGGSGPRRRAAGATPVLSALPADLEGPSKPSSLARFLPVSQYLLELASGVWVLEFGVLASPGA